MTWFKVDDSFPDHPKLEELHGDPMRYMSAVTVWTIMGADCARRLTDGFVSKLRLTKVLGHLKKYAALGVNELVGCGLWDVEGDGWRFHDWADYQPTKAEVEKSRKLKSERHRRWKDGSGDAAVDASTDADEDGFEDGAGDSAHARDPVPSRPDLSRPDPTSPAERGEFAEGASSRKPRPRSAKPIAESAAVWAAYAEAYRARYREPPVRNAKVNGQLAQLVRRVPAAEAPDVVRHYLRSNNGRYVAAGHSVGCLLQDAEKLRTEWATSTHGTAFAAREADRQAGRGDAHRAVLAELRAEDEADALGRLGS